MAPNRKGLAVCLDLFPGQHAADEVHAIANAGKGFSKGMPFQPSTITFEDVPMSIANRPGAASAGLAALIASSAGPHGVKAGMIATPSRIAGAQGGQSPGA